jgi:hypothetical protein
MLRSSFLANGRTPLTLATMARNAQVPEESSEQVA